MSQYVTHIATILPWYRHNHISFNLYGDRKNLESTMNRPRQNLSFVYRPAKDEPAVTESDLSRQLHSSVRTPNLETSLRLLSQGADPNYYHPEKNSTPLQVRFTLHYSASSL